MEAKGEKTQTQTKSIDVKTSLNQQEFELMLNELDAANKALEDSRQQFEQRVSALLTGSTAIGGAVVLISTSSNAALSSPQIVSLLLLLLAGFCSGSFLRLCNTKVSIASAHAQVGSKRLYFIKQFPNVEGYIEARSLPDRYKVTEVVFSSQVRLLLTALYVFTAMTISLAVGLLLFGYTKVSSEQPLILATIVAIIAFAFATIAANQYLTRQINRAQTLTKIILDAAQQTASRGG